MIHKSTSRTWSDWIGYLHYSMSNRMLLVISIAITNDLHVL